AEKRIWDVLLLGASLTPGLKPRPPKEEETPLAHPYQNKGFAKQNGKFLSPLFSHRCAQLRLQTLCFDMLHKNTRGWEVTPVATVCSRIGIGGGVRGKTRGAGCIVPLKGAARPGCRWGKRGGAGGGVAGKGAG